MKFQCLEKGVNFDKLEFYSCLFGNVGDENQKSQSKLAFLVLLTIKQNG